MQTFLAGPLPDNARNLMRRLGYGEHTGYGGQISYTRRITGERYPHYHVYAEDKNGGIQINLHLDQKPSNLGSGARHAGEYEGPLVEREMTRLRDMIISISVSTKPQETPKEKKGFWSSLMG